MGTRLCATNSRMLSKPARSASQPRARRAAAGRSMATSSFGDNDFLALDVHGVWLEPASRRPAHDLAIEIEQPVVTGAPDLARRFAVLHGAIQVRADRRKRAPLALHGAHQQRRSAAELEYPGAVWLQVGD